MSPAKYNGCLNLTVCWKLSLKLTLMLKKTQIFGLNQPEGMKIKLKVLQSKLMLKKTKLYGQVPSLFKCPHFQANMILMN